MTRIVAFIMPHVIHLLPNLEAPGSFGMQVMAGPMQGLESA